MGGGGGGGDTEAHRHSSNTCKRTSLAPYLEEAAGVIGQACSAATTGLDQALFRLSLLLELVFLFGNRAAAHKVNNDMTTGRLAQGKGAARG